MLIYAWELINVGQGSLGFLVGQGNLGFVVGQGGLGFVVGDKEALAS